MSAAAPVVEVLPIRLSHLKAMARSPKHAKYIYDQDVAGNYRIEDTPAMLFGRLAHSLVLGTTPPLVGPGDRRGTTAWKTFLEANPGRDVVKQDEYDTASYMADSILANEEAFQLLQGEREKSIRFTLAGRLCRVTPDAHLLGEHLTELKTTTDASPERFPWTALRLGYFAQLAMQKDGIVAAGMRSPARVAIVVIETKPPHAVCVYDLSPGAEEFGRRQYTLWLNRFLVCEQSGEWPGYGPGVLEPPMETQPLIGPDGELID